MNKKTYIQPTIKTKVMDATETMLAASGELYINNTVGTGVGLSKDNNQVENNQQLPNTKSVWED